MAGQFSIKNPLFLSGFGLLWTVLDYILVKAAEGELYSDVDINRVESILSNVYRISSDR
jgi:hypothetical protein